VSIPAWVRYELGQQRALAILLDAVSPREGSVSHSPPAAPAEAQILDFPIQNKRPAQPLARTDAGLPIEKEASDDDD
jgi:hypothetical protein